MKVSNKVSVKITKIAKTAKISQTMRLAASILLVLPVLLTAINLPAQSPAAAKPQPSTRTTAAEPWAKIPIPPLPAFNPAQPRRIVLQK